uniref:Uncharacterized protein n=1 Tax=Sphaerodactylus townsendi TaxID=933632 RepID=A0ACB8E591_9SAUR
MSPRHPVGAWQKEDDTPAAMAAPSSRTGLPTFPTYKVALGTENVGAAELGLDPHDSKECRRHSGLHRVFDEP